MIVPTLPPMVDNQSSYKPEIMTSTPYQKFDRSSKALYRYEDGFYQDTKNHNRHPVLELFKSEQFKKFFTWTTSYFASLPKIEESQFEIVLNVCFETATLLEELQATQVVFERTPEESLLCKANVNLQNEKPLQLFLAVYFDETELSGYEAILNVFQERQQVLTISGKFEDLQKRLHHFFAMLSTPTIA